MEYVGFFVLLIVGGVGACVFSWAALLAAALQQREIVVVSAVMAILGWAAVVTALTHSPFSITLKG